MPTRATVTVADFSSSIRRGALREEWATLPMRRHASSFTVLGWSITVTVTRGASGARPLPADLGRPFTAEWWQQAHAWERANRAALVDESEA